MSKLGKAMIAILDVFEEYAGKDDKKKTLSNAELHTLVKEQLSGPEFQDKIDPEDVREALEKIDKNHDGEVNFKEFSQCMAHLSQGYFRKKYGKDKGKGKGK